MKKPTLREQNDKLNACIKIQNDIISTLNAKINSLEDQIKQLSSDKRWLQILAQELSAAINAGCREGSLPRRY